MLAAKVSEDHPFVLSLFGCQYHGAAPSPSKTSLITAFDALLQSSPAARVETLEQDLPHIPTDGDASSSAPSSSRLWMTYFRSPADYHRWWDSPAVHAFWSALPDDAGFWREKLLLTHSRTLFETNKELRNGFSSVGELVPLGDKTGYWGAYRDRLQDATPQDRLSSPLKGVPAPKKADGSVRRGRVRMTTFPDNLCFVVEGQDYQDMGKGESEYWDEHFDDLTKRWVTHCVDAGPDAGMVLARSCFAPQHGRRETSVRDDDGRWARSFAFNRRVQLFYFLDLSRMERIGKSVKVHVELRKKFMEAYGPKGAQFGGDLLLWVELGVLKARDVEAEYVGCYDATGFMAYEDDPAFRRQGVWGEWSPWGVVQKASQYVFG